MLIKKNKLLSALKAAECICRIKSPVEGLILSRIWLSRPKDSEVLIVSAYNMDASIEVFCQPEDDSSLPLLGVDGERLLELVDSVREENLDFSMILDRKSGIVLVLKAGKGKYQIPATIDFPFDYIDPSAEPVKVSEISLSKLLRSIRWTKFATANSKDRGINPVLGSINFSFGEYFQAIATDGYQMARVRFEESSTTLDLTIQVGVLADVNRCVDLIGDIEGVVQIHVDRDFFILSQNCFRFHLRPQTLPFPQISSVIDKFLGESTSRWLLPIGDTINALAIALSYKSERVDLRLSDSRSVSVQGASELGSFSTTLFMPDDGSEISGEGFSCNPLFLSEIFRYLPSEKQSYCEVIFSHPHSPILFLPSPELKILLMPFKSSG